MDIFGLVVFKYSETRYKVLRIVVKNSRGEVVQDFSQEAGDQREVDFYYRTVGFIVDQVKPGYTGLIYGVVDGEKDVLISECRFDVDHAV